MAKSRVERVTTLKWIDAILRSHHESQIFLKDTCTSLLEVRFKIMSSSDSDSVEKTMPRINIIDAASYGAPSVANRQIALTDGNPPTTPGIFMNRKS